MFVIAVLFKRAGQNRYGCSNNKTFGNFEHVGRVFKGIPVLLQGRFLSKLRSTNDGPDCTELERMIRNDLKLQRIKTAFQRLNLADDSSLAELKKSTWGDVFYSFNQSKEYEKLDVIRKRTKDLSINCGEGAYTTVIRSWLTRGQVAKAVDILVDMKHKGLLRHSRTYFDVITSLAEKGYQEKAFQLFYEMQHHIFRSNKNVSLAIPSKMSVALIRSCIVDEGREADYGKGKDVLKLYTQSGWPLKSDVFEAIKEWLNNDPDNNWIVKQCTISAQGLCDSCNQFLDRGLITSSERQDLQKDILNTIQQIFKAEEKIPRINFEKFDSFVHQCGLFDVIIDGMNIGFSSNIQKQMKKFNFDAISKVVHHIAEQDKRVLVIVDRSIKLPDLLGNCQCFVTDVGFDDLYIIYACAAMSLTPYVVTRDKFRNHRFILEFDNRSCYLKWIRSHTLRLGVKNKNCTFDMQQYDPVVQQGDTGWHFPLVGGRWFCAKLRISK